MLEDEKEDFLLVEGEAEGNSREGLSGEGNVVNREDPSSDSSPLRLRAHSLPEGHAKTGRQGEGNSLYSNSHCISCHVYRDENEKIVIHIYIYIYVYRNTFGKSM